MLWSFSERYLISQKSFIVIVVTFLLMILPASSRAALDEISEYELSQVSAQSGMTYVIGGSQLRITYDSYRFSDTDHTPHNWIEFNNITIDDGSGGYFSKDTPEDVDAWNTLDVATDTDGATGIYMNLSLDVQPRTYTVGNFVFCDQDLGSLQLVNARRGASDNLIITGRTDGTCGINMEYDTEITIDSAKFIYNTASDELSFNGIHLVGSSSGSPEDPATWTYTDKFKFGDIANSNPLTIDVKTGISTSTGNPLTGIVYNVPMQGSLRVESVSFDTSDFGPVAIDGINVHHFGIIVAPE